MCAIQTSTPDRQLLELTILHRIALASVESTSTDELLKRVTQTLSETLFPHHCGVLLLDEHTQCLRPHASYHGISADSLQCEIPLGRGISGQVALERKARRVGDTNVDPSYWMVNPNTRSELSVPLVLNHSFIGVLNVESPEWNAFSERDEQLLITIAGQLATAIERIRLLEQTQQRYQQLLSLNRTSLAITGLLNRAELLEQLATQVLELLHPDTFMVAFYDSLSHSLKIALAIEESRHLSEVENLEFPLDEGGLTGWIMKHHTSLLVEDMSKNALPAQPRHTGRPAQSWVGVPLLAHGRLIGVISVQSFQPYAFNEEDCRFLESLANQVAIALENARLYEEAQQRLARLAALKDIDRAITSNHNLDETLSVLLEQVRAQLGVDAADILLLNREEHTLDFAAGAGFRTAALKHTRLMLGESYAGKAAQKRMIVHIPDLKSHPTAFERSEDFASESFDEYFAVPLTNKDEVIGVLEVFHRQPIHAQNEWLQFLEALATQASIAIDNARLFSDLQTSHQQLIRAYDATLEGWSRALELRDQDTQGHTRRVTEMTVRLARAMGVPENQIEHIFRGAMLHDIGKMAIPDHVLKKPGELNEEENTIIQQHPEKAYEMLSSIEFLHPALDIPRYHHEKWDGSGYPYGLKGEEIPLAARIFAVVDVWDALRSKRPYRQAWSEEDISIYLKEQAGKHFDPAVVDTFLKLLQEHPNSTSTHTQ